MVRYVIPDRLVVVLLFSGVCRDLGVVPRCPLPQCRQACPAVQRKKTKPSCMSTHESWKGARSKQANTTSIKHYNSLRQQASPAGGLLTPSSHGCQCSDESMIAWPPASLLPRMCSGLLPRHHGCSDESNRGMMLAGRLTRFGTIRVRLKVSPRRPLSGRTPPAHSERALVPWEMRLPPKCHIFRRRTADTSSIARGRSGWPGFCRLLLGTCRATRV